jgi:hypothetical protein
MVTSVTWFDGVRSTQGRRLSLKDSGLNRFVEKPRSHDGDKLGLPMWSPGTFMGDKRLLANVESVSMIVLDIDSLHVGTEEFLARLNKSLPIGWWVHTSFSSQPGALRFRAFARYERPVSVDEHRRCMVIASLTLERAGVPIDGACKDASRGYFVPARAIGKPYECRIVRGDAFPVQCALDTYAKRIQHDVDALQAGEPQPAWESTRGDERRAMAYLERVPGAFAGQRGHDHTFNTALKLVKGFGLSNTAALSLLTKWNRRCNPPWTVNELKRKILQAEGGRLPNNFMQYTRKTGSR